MATDDGTHAHPPSLQALASFDAAARHGSFTGAAKELGVGQPAVSHAVRVLEHALGETLFQRRHRGVELTAAGRGLADAVRRGPVAIEDGIDELRRRRQVGRTVTIGASTATAAYWLIPRLAQCKLANPDIDVQCITSDTNGFDTDTLDLFIPVGRGVWPDSDRWVVAHEVVYPICSAAYSAEIDDLPLSLEQLALKPLLHLQERHRSRLSWAQWFDAVGGVMGHARGIMMANDYTVLLQAVQAGNGIALGWHHIVADMVDHGLLVRPVAEEVATGRPIHLHAPLARPRSPEVDVVRSWLTTEESSAVMAPTSASLGTTATLGDRLNEGILDA